MSRGRGLAKSGMERHGPQGRLFCGKCWRSQDRDVAVAEAIPPDVLVGMVPGPIEARQEANALRQVLEREAEARAGLMQQLEGMA
ncbi:hypothetical protein GI374_05445 [Paracoccus sp. S-4012]|uniref:hypothetical protein n=1 Tax=Paracoccus sp. S-4012 TaxID=2665648 RepID=UPI0012AFA573|nr:hypothetical protein [Paracoccus sp. S-4012]MRX49905.1 hypothetical protein [Paracoccus sp. S-4012]